jgi:hypothetical protein
MFSSADFAGETPSAAPSTGLPNGSGPGAGSSPPHAFESGAAESRKSV